MLPTDERMKDALELAMMSTDPAVRQLALRFKAMHQEIEALNGFFVIYFGADVPPPVRAEPKAVAGNGATHHKPAVSAAPAAKPPTITKVLQNVLTHGPLDLDALHAAYVAQVPADAGRVRPQSRVVQWTTNVHLAHWTLAGKREPAAPALPHGRAVGRSAVNREWRRECGQVVRHTRDEGTTLVA